jgi:hypothetical protein
MPIESDEADIRNAEALLQNLLHPSKDQLMRIYKRWAKQQHYWTVEEAAALVMGADPDVVKMYEFLPSEERRIFDRLVDIIRRKFPDKVFPADLRDFAPTVDVENKLLWRAIDYCAPKEQKALRKADEKKRKQTDDKILLALALDLGFRLDRDNPATGKIKHVTERAGTALDDGTIHDHLEQLVKRNPDLNKVVAEYWKDRA